MSDQTTESSVKTLIADRPTLVLSPHMDDAMLSAAAIVLDTPATVWTLFTGDPIPPQTTSWDLSCGFANSHETITARRVEDQNAFDGTPSTWRHLDAWEGAYATPEQRRRDMPMLRREITTWLEQHPDGVLVLPACAGLHVPTPWWAGLRDRLEASKASASHPNADTPRSQNVGSPAQQPETARNSLQGRVASAGALVKHKARGAVGRAMHIDAQRRRRKVIGESGLAANPDHIVARDLGLDLAKAFPGVQVLLFEDLPYLWHERGDASASRVAQSHGMTAEKIVVPVDADAKFEHLQHYTSQMPVMDSAGRLTQREHISGQEVYWRLR